MMLDLNSNQQTLNESKSNQILDHGYGSIVFGIVVSTIFFGSLGLWSFFAPLEAAAIAPGTVKVETSQLTIDHPDGGVIATLMVKEGDTVEAGDLLVSLDTTQLSSELIILKQRRVFLLAKKARLISLQENSTDLSLSYSLKNLEKTDATIRETIQMQRQLLQAELISHSASERAKLESLVQLKERIQGIELQIGALDENLIVTEIELEDVQSLFKEGLVSKPRVLAITKERIRIIGQIGVLKTELARHKSSMIGVELDINQIRSERLAKIAGQMQELNTELNGLTPKLSALQNRLRRTILRAPRDGRVFKLNKFSSGETIRASEPIMQIVPVNVALVVEADFKLVDREILNPGMHARVRFTGFGYTEQEPVNATIDNISADIVKDAATGKTSYKAVVRIASEEFDGRNINLEAGMPAEVIVPLKARTLIEYLLEPLVRYWSTAFREN